MAMVAGLIAAVRLARVDSEELTRRSPRVRCAIHDSVTNRRNGDCGDQSKAMNMQDHSASSPPQTVEELAKLIQAIPN